MKLIYKSRTRYMVLINEQDKKDERVYFGNGEEYNGFFVCPLQVLRFNDALEYVGEKHIPIPEKIIRYIESHMQELEKVPKTTVILNKIKKDI